MSSKNPPRDCLFIINGLGMGNSTRCHAVMEHLVERGLHVHVLTSGGGLRYFEGRQEVSSLTPMESFFYSSKRGRVSALGTVASLDRLARLAATKRRQLQSLLSRIRPAVAITDSEYGLGSLRRQGIPVLAVNNADVVVSEYFRRKNKPGSIRNHFWMIEYADYLFHRWFCDMVISPSVAPCPPRHDRIRRTGLILRRAVSEALPRSRKPFPPPRNIRSAVFMLSGSVLASSISFSAGELPFRVDVVGREGASTNRIVYHGKILNNVRLLCAADVLVINGGFSAVSEAIALNKPTFVIPVPGHAEQYLNARVLSDLGFGYIADERNVVRQLLHMYEINRWEGLKERGQITGLEGAREAAEIIVEAATARSNVRRAWENRT